jgi:carbonic anhydrase/acetyltransferase-like protein (isoleucine patch superfamily)
MASLIELDEMAPTIGEGVYLAPSAVLIGDVRIGDGASVWFGAVLRADFSYIEVGAGSCIQDNAVLHCATDLPTVVGDGVVVGHGCILEGCVIEPGALVGMGSIVCQGATVGAGAMLAAGSVVAERVQLPGGVLAAGVPAARKKDLDGAALRWRHGAAAEYHRLRDRYLINAKETV